MNMINIIRISPIKMIEILNLFCIFVICSDFECSLLVLFNACVRNFLLFISTWEVGHILIIVWLSAKILLQCFLPFFHAFRNGVLHIKKKIELSRPLTGIRVHVNGLFDISRTIFWHLTHVDLIFNIARYSQTISSSITTFDNLVLFSKFTCKPLVNLS